MHTNRVKYDAWKSMDLSIDFSQILEWHLFADAHTKFDCKNRLNPLNEWKCCDIPILNMQAINPICHYIIFFFPFIRHFRWPKRVLKRRGENENWLVFSVAETFLRLRMRWHCISVSCEKIKSYATHHTHWKCACWARIAIAIFSISLFHTFPLARAFRL